MSLHDVTVVIPTRNRLDELVATVESVLASDHPDVTVAVFDNCSDDGTSSAVKSRFGDRIVLRRSEQPLAMVDSFESAYEMADSKWVIGIGADDGLHPSAISRLVEVALREEVLAVTPLRAGYRWPDVSAGLEGELRIPPMHPDRVVTSQAMIRKVLSGKAKWFLLPSGYAGLLDREVLESIRRRHGRVFTSLTPDVGMNFAVAREVERYVICGQPLVLAGASSRSNGSSQFGIGDPEIVRSFWQENSRSVLGLHPRIAVVAPELPASMRVIALEAFLQSGGPVGLRERTLSSDLLQSWLASLSPHEPDWWWERLAASKRANPLKRIAWAVLKGVASAWRSTATARQYFRAGRKRVRIACGLKVDDPILKHAVKQRGVASLKDAATLLERYVRDGVTNLHSRETRRQK